MQDRPAPGSPVSALDLSTILRRIRRNAGVTVIGQGAIVGLGFIALALNARALGASGLGTLTIIISLGVLIERLLAFQSWQAVVKLGQDAIASSDHRRLREVIASAFLFDLATSLTASVAGILAVLTAGEWLGIPPDVVPFAAIYMATLATRIADAPMGVLRLNDRFGLLVSAQAAGAAMLCLLAITLFLLGAPLRVYVLGIAAVGVVSNLLLIGVGIAVAKRSGAAPSWPSRAALKAFWSFSWAASLSATINSMKQQGLVLLLGAVLGPAAVGVFHVAVSIAGALGLVHIATHEAVFPETARLVSERRRADIHRISIVSGLAGCGIALAALAVLVPFGAEIAALVGSRSYVGAHWPMVILVAGYCLVMSGVGLRAAVINGIGPRAMLAINAVSLSPMLLAPLAIQHFAVTGAALSLLAFDAVWLAATTTVYTRWMRRSR